MRKSLLATLCIVFLSFAFTIDAQNKRYTILFYNVENVFDTIHQENVKDFEFTPEGANKWTGAKYWKKMSNLEKVFYSISAENKAFPTIIGVSEIENRNVLEDMAYLEKIRKANYQIVHYDSPDPRGVDVAFFYRPDQFELEGSIPLKTEVEEMPDFKTRDILAMWGNIDGEKFLFMVAHWPSRIGGQQASNFKRCGAAKTMRKFADSFVAENPGTKVIMMGDLNDDPTNESIHKILNAKGYEKDLNGSDLFNPFYSMFKDGYGTLAYQDKWSLFDNIIVSENLITDNETSLRIVKNKKGYYGNIFNRPMLCHKSGQYKGYPLRTYVGGNFQNGFSDHFPVFINIEK